MKKIKPCLDCGNTDIQIGDCGYSSFNVAQAKCKKCGNFKQFNCGTFIKEDEIIKVWNDANNPKKLISDLNKQIKKIEKEKNKIEKKARRIYEEKAV